MQLIARIICWFRRSQMKASSDSPSCPACGNRLSDWFVWTNGERHCWLCYKRWNDGMTILESGQVVPFRE